MEATEIEAMRVTLANSRVEFQIREGSEFDKAVHESVLVFEQARQQVMKKKVLPCLLCLCGCTT